MRYSLMEKFFIFMKYREFYDIFFKKETIFQWFNLLGYDRDLYSVRSRCFLITFHR